MDNDRMEGLRRYFDVLAPLALTYSLIAAALNGLAQRFADVDRLLPLLFELQLPIESIVIRLVVTCTVVWIVTEILVYHVCRRAWVQRVVEERVGNLVLRTITWVLVTVCRRIVIFVRTPYVIYVVSVIIGWY